MKCNADKCVVKNIGNLKIKSKYEYKMNNQILETMKHHPYLGVELSENMKYNNHIDTITSKASGVLGFVKRNLRHCPRTVKERAYHTLVRPKLEYSSPIRNPQQKTQIKQLEQVQRNAVRFVLNPTDIKVHLVEMSA